MQLDHIALIVSDEKNLSFYEKIGFKETKRISRSCDTVVFMEYSKITLEIFVDSNHSQRDYLNETSGLRHIAFAVNDFDRLKREFECETIRADFFGRHFMFIKDPDGQPIEIIEKG